MNIEYAVIYLICNLLQIYIIYYLYRIFFKEQKTSQRTEIISYIAFYVVNSTLYLVFQIPIINVLSSIVGFFLLTYNYSCSVWKRLIIVILLYVFMACSETIASSIFSSGQISFVEPNRQIYIQIPIASTIIMYILSLSLGKLKNIKNQVKVPVFYWVFLITLPICALYFLILLLQNSDFSIRTISVCSTFILFFVFSTFYLYDAVIAELSSKMEKELLAQQNKFYHYHIKQMKSSIDTTRKLQHDIKNHLLAIRSYASKGANQELLQYLAEIEMASGQSKAWVFTGNTVIDSVLNFKIQEAEQKDIVVKTTLKVPDTLNVSSFELVIILGNLLDNAIFAVEKVPEERQIDFSMAYSKGRILLQVKNPFCGKLEKDHNRFLTTKANKEQHGLGLQNVENTVKKYNGTMEIDTENDLFTVSIVMYLDA